MATTVFLVRHAEAEGNVYRRCHGQYDSLLTTHGEAQLPYLAKRFADVPLDAVYASDLYRARMTAKAIADPHGLDIQVRPILREISMGDWEDKTWAELPLEYPEEFDCWLHRPWIAAAPGGENILQSGARVLEGVRELVRENGEKTFAIVAHGSVIRGALCILLGLAPEQLAELEWGDNTCVSKILFAEDGTAEIEYRNDVSHLPLTMQTFHSIGWRDAKGVPSSVQVWFRPVNLQSSAERETLLDFAAQKYQNAYGNTDGLQKVQYLEDTADMLREDARAVTFGMLADEPVALVRLNMCDNAKADMGMVGSFVINTPYRGRGISQQMLGHAISVYRARGKHKLGAYVAEKNARAQGFYHKYGFVRDGEMHNENGLHFRMVKQIGVAPYAGIRHGRQS